MTSPQDAAKPAAAAADAPTRRPGQLVTYRHPDPVTGRDLEGAAVVLAADDQGLIIAPVSDHHLRVALDAVSTVRAADVPTSVATPDPEPAAG